MKFTVNDQLTPGTYEMEFDGVKELQTQHGQCALLIFRCVENGPLHGLDSTFLANARVTNGSKLGRMIVSLRGGIPLEPNEKIDLTEYYRVRGRATIVKNEKNDRIVVDGFVRHPEQPTQQPTAQQQPSATTASQPDPDAPF